ncbi:MAG: hypothetical protein ACREX4_22080 [Gammaproteobacteria bacterium]
MKSRALPAALLLILGEAYAADQKAFRVTGVAPGLFMHDGRHVDLEHPEHSDIGEIGNSERNKWVLFDEVHGRNVT